MAFAMMVMAAPAAVVDSKAAAVVGSVGNVAAPLMAPVIADKKVERAQVPAAPVNGKVLCDGGYQHDS
ncbi:hypothetical protein H4R99_008590, partial [Coemansia sp. RSA 1722]